MKSKTKKILIFIFILFLIFIFIGLQNEIVVTNYIIKDERIKTPFKIMLLTDTHSNKFGQNHKKLLYKIYEQNPDAVILGGDIIDDVLPMENGFELVKEISKKFPTFYSTGNHEIWSEKDEYIKERIKSYGVNVLEGNIKELLLKDNKINIMGVDDPDNYHVYEKQIENLMNRNKSDNIEFLIAHRPEKVDTYKKLNLDYVFSGHAHGGQWRIPFILQNGLLAPNQGFFPKYTNGVQEFNEYTHIISRGLTTQTTWVPRFYNPPEIVVVEFINR